MYKAVYIGQSFGEGPRGNHRYIQEVGPHQTQNKRIQLPRKETESAIWVCVSSLGPFNDTFNFSQYGRLPPWSPVGTAVFIRATDTLVEVSERILVAQRRCSTVTIEWCCREVFSLVKTIKAGGNVFLWLVPATPKSS